MRRVLLVTWALGTASGVLLGLFGVQLVSSRISTNPVSPLSHPEVVRALQAARSVPASPEEIALSAGPPDSSPQVDAAPARPSAGATPTPAPSSPASSLPRPGATAGTPEPAVAASVPSTTATGPAPPSPTSTTATTVEVTASTGKPKSDSKSERTTTSTSKKATTTTAKPSKDDGSDDSSDDSDETETKTIKGDWGVVVVTFSDGKVRAKMARPNAGYEVRPISYGPDYVLIYFDKGSRGYRVWASYYRGEPFTDVTRCSGRWPRPDCSRR